jgi:hypothetical protein
MTFIYLVLTAIVAFIGVYYTDKLSETDNDALTIVSGITTGVFILYFLGYAIDSSVKPVKSIKPVTPIVTATPTPIKTCNCAK